jgi:hypothetical protein
LKQSSRIWFETLAKFFFSLDYVSLNVEFNVFMKNEIMIAIYVNDLILTASTNSESAKKLDFGENGENQRSIHFSAESYIFQRKLKFSI